MSTDQHEPAVPVRMIGGPVQVFDDPDLLPADADSLLTVQSMVRGTDLVAPPAASLHSACHGAGTVIEDLVARGISRVDPLGRKTLRYRYSDAAPTEVPHYDNRGVDAALDVLVRHRLVRPVARMRPIAVLH